MNGEYQNYEHQQYDSQQYEHAAPSTDYANETYYAYPVTTTSYDNMSYHATTGYDAGAGYDQSGYGGTPAYDTTQNGTAAYPAAHNDTEIAGYNPASYDSQTGAYNSSSAHTDAAYNGDEYELATYGGNDASYYSPVPAKSVAPEVIAQRSRNAVAKPLNMKTKEVKRAVELGGGLDLFTKKGVNDEHDLEESLSDDDDVVKLEKLRAERGKWAQKILQRKKEIFGQTPEGLLLEHSDTGHMDHFMHILSLGPKIETQFDDQHETHAGFSAMHLAAFRNHTEMVKMLLLSRVNPDAQEANGFAPIHFACVHGSTPIVRLLIEAGANKEVMTNHGYTPLHTAVRNDRLATAEALIRSKADIDALSRGSNNSALHFATYKQNKAMVKMLLECKISLHLRNSCNRTALHAAFSNRNEIIRTMIIEAGGLLQFESTFGSYEAEPEEEVRVDKDPTSLTTANDFVSYFRKR